MPIHLPPSPKPGRSPTVLVVKILLIILILLLLPKLVEVRGNAANRRRKAQEKKFKEMKKECESDREQCGKLIPEENMNCVNNCISTNCFNEVYAGNLLEQGEIDFRRNNLFESCVKKEIRFATARKKIASL